MKSYYIPLIITFFIAQLWAEESDPDRAKNTIILDKIKVQNLGVELAEVEENSFSETTFALGELQIIPQKTASLTSPISGRILSLNVYESDQITSGESVMRVESFLPGSPPPSITLEAPITGTVLQSMVQTGGSVTKGEALMKIVDLSSLWAIAYLPQEEAKVIQSDTEAHIRLLAKPDLKLIGKFVRFATQADAQHGIIPTIFLIENSDLSLRPGMTAEFQIIKSKGEEVMQVPTSAIQGDTTDRYVYVEDFELEYSYVKAPVVTGRKNGEFTEIYSGLFPGDQIVTKGGYFLSTSSGGGMSLKEALDAAHGHEHNEDGTPVTDEQRKARQMATGGDISDETGSGGSAKLWKYLSFIFGALMIGMLLQIISYKQKLKEGLNETIINGDSEEPQTTSEETK